MHDAAVDAGFDACNFQLPERWRTRLAEMLDDRRGRIAVSWSSESEGYVPETPDIQLITCGVRCLSALPEFHAAEKSITDHVLKVVGEVERRRQDPGSQRVGNVCQLLGIVGEHELHYCYYGTPCKTQTKKPTVLVCRLRCRDVYGDRILISPRAVS